MRVVQLWSRLAQRVGLIDISSERPRLAEEKRPVLDNLLGHEIEERSDLWPFTQVGMRQQPEAESQFRPWINHTDKIVLWVPNLAGQ